MGLRQHLMVVLACGATVVGLSEQPSLALQAVSPSAVTAAPAPGVLLAQAAVPASVAAGQDAFVRQCGICHNVDKGGPDRYGPNLFGIVGKQAGTEAGFVYSAAFVKSATWKWDTALLGGWISSPGALIPGTAMAIFQGVADKDRDNIIAYLGSLK